MNQKILKLAIPNIISNITVPLLGMVDLALMGHLDDSIYIDAIALGGMIFNFIYWSFGFLRMGTAGFTAQAYGGRNFHESIMTLLRALLVGTFAGGMLILLQYPINKLSFVLLGGKVEVENLASQYYYIRIWAAPATLGLYALYGWFIGMQNARIPMIMAISVNIINLAANLFFVKVLGMQSDGVALGTVIAQYSGFILGIFFLHKYYRRLYKYVSWQALKNLTKLKTFMVVNKDIFIRTMCLIFVFSFFTARSAKSDALSTSAETILAVNVLLQQFFMLFSYLIDGFAYAAEALTGKLIGAGNKKDLKTIVRLLFAWGAGLGLVFSLMYAAFGSNLLHIFTDNELVISNAKPYLPWVGIIPIISFAAFVWDGIYIGATASVSMRNSMLISTLLVFFPCYFFLQGNLGNHALWFAFSLFMFARGLSLWFMAKKSIYEKVKVKFSHT